MNKVDQAIQQLVEFAKTFFKTFYNILVKPYAFFLTVYKVEDKENRTNPLTYLLLSTFAFVFTIHTKKLTDLFWDGSNFNFLLYTEKFKFLINSLFSISFEKLIVISFPIVVFVYLVSKILSYLIADKSVRPKFSEVVVYFSATSFLLYFTVFIFIIFVSKACMFFTPDEQGRVASVFWIMVLLFALLSLLRAIFALWRILSDNEQLENKLRSMSSRMRLPFQKVIGLYKLDFTRIIKDQHRFSFLVLAAVVALVVFSYIIARDQKKFDNMLNLTRGKETGFSILKRDSTAYFEIVKIKTGDTQYAYLNLDLVVSNHSDNILIFNSLKKECASVFISDSPFVDETSIIELPLHEVTLSNYDNKDFESKLLLMPGEMQLLNLLCRLDSVAYGKLNYFYYKNDKPFNRFKFLITLKYEQGPEDRSNVSDYYDLKIRDFLPDAELYAKGKKSFVPIARRDSLKGGGGASD